MKYTSKTTLYIGIIGLISIVSCKQAEIKPEIAAYAPGENEFYRMTKTFQRTKNDAMQLGYYDLNHFNSTMERNTTQLFKQLGQPMSDGFTNYTTGTLVTDALFGVQYYLLSHSSHHKRKEYFYNQIHLVELLCLLLFEY